MVSGSVIFLWRSSQASRGDGEGDAAKIWNGLAEIFAELEKHPFTKAGSLCVESHGDLPLVSTTASDRFVCLDP